MRSKVILWITLLSIAFMLPANLSAQQEESGNQKNKGPLTIDFDLFHTDNNQELRPKITVDYNQESFSSWNEKKLSIGVCSLDADVKAQFVHAWGTEVNNEPSYAQVSFGLLWNMAHKEPLIDLPGTQDGLPPAGPPVGERGFVPIREPPKDSPKKKDYNYGKIGLKGFGLADTDENTENTNLTAGIELAYSAVGAFDQWLLPLPSLWLNLDHVTPQNADAREDLGVDTSAFTRFRGALLWSWDFGADLWSESAIGKQLAIQLHYRYAREFGQDRAWEDRDFDEYDQFNIKLTYRFERKSVNKWGLRDLYTGYTTGRFIAHEEDDNRVYLGVTLQ